MRSLVFLALSCALLLLSSLPESSAGCSCSLSDSSCPSWCATCLYTYKYCTCNTGCETSDCSSGYTEISGCNWPSCCTWPWEDKETCQRRAWHRTSSCASCPANRYGSGCWSCPGGTSNPCNGRGSCSDGIYGSGTCSCNAGYAGYSCQYSDADTCSGHGEAQYDGSCVCDYGFTGSDCNQCTVYRYPEPTGSSGTFCNRFCRESTTCYGQGYCNSQGYCVCNFGITGSRCDRCSTDRHNYPTCRYCKDSTTCSGHGTCNSLGYCNCNPYHINSDCSECEPGRYGQDCDSCPGGASNPCNGYGTCDEGINGGGSCDCDDDYIGDDCYQPHILSVRPDSIPREGGVAITLTGKLFSSIGTVYLESNPLFLCPIIQYLDESVVCIPTPPPSAEDTLSINLRRLLDGRVSNTVTISFGSPAITEVSPLRSPTTGAGVTVTVLGTSFGTSATRVHFNEEDVTSTATLSVTPRPQVTFPLPAGVGENIPIVIEVDGRFSSANTEFSYDPPEALTISPANGPTDGRVITITGLNFGTPASNGGVEPMEVTIDGEPCVFVADDPDRDDRTIHCTTPDGAGTGKVVSVGLKGSSNPAYVDSSLTFDYDPPVILSYRTCIRFNSFPECCDKSGSKGINCPRTSNGDVEIDFNGNNLGPVDTIPDLDVFVGGVRCTSVVGQAAHSRLRCRLPNGRGADLPVQVLRDGVGTTTDALITYVGPKITPGSLEFVDIATPVVGSITLSSTTGGCPGACTKVRFGGSFSDAVEPVVVYGPPRTGSNTSNADPLLGIYPCSVSSYSTTSIECRVSPGVGKGLVFQVWADGIPSNVGIDTLSYPAPSITIGTLRAAGRPLSDARTTYIANSTQGEAVEFDGTNFGGAAASVSEETLRVTYGPKTNRFKYKCDVDYTTGATTDTTIRCTTRPGVGANLEFAVQTGTAAGFRSAVSNDTFNYPAAPTITSVRGCPVAFGSGTTQCPTDALDSDGEPLRLTIVGQSFQLAQTAVTVGGAPCLDVVHKVGSENTELTCVLPVGAGLRRAVVVSRQSFFSQPSSLVSYARPVVTSVTGCDDYTITSTTTALATRHCPRTGGVNITLTGTNFGASNAKVVIGGVTCDNVVHSPDSPHTQVSCTLPTGVATERSVILVQHDGELSNDPDMVLSYFQCEAGSFSEGDINCTLCDPGMYANLEGQTRCLPCAKGTFATGYGNTECKRCSAGSQAPEEGATGCVDCQVGTFAATAGSILCEPCPTGEFAATNRSTSCAKCPAGSYQPQTGRSSCIACPAGKVTASSGQARCVGCEIGTFSSGTGRSNCTKCPRGSVSARTVASTECRVCDPGSYAAVAGQASCIVCPVGKYQPQNGTSECLRCPRGTYNPTAGATECLLCANGTFASSEESATCAACPSGTYAAEEGSDQCLACPAGSAQRNSGSDSCELCPMGTYVSATGQAVCFECPPGTFTDGPGRVNCTDCPVGTAGNSHFQTGSTACTPCPPGYFASTEGRPNCTACPLGRAAPDFGAAQCDECPRGKFVDQPGAFTCTNCTNGTFAIAPASYTCEQCDLGRYAARDGMSSCVACAPGTFGSERGMSQCTPCPLGSSARAAGAYECEICDAGTFTNATGMPQCLRCPRGRFGPREGPDEGAHGCHDCYPGNYADREALATCFPCLPGKYQPGFGAEGCLDCAPGRYQNEQNQTSCKPCEPGSANAVDGQKVCLPCGTGTHQDVDGQQTCKECAAGTFSSRLGAVLCDDCPGGRYAPSDGADACVACSRGSAQALTGQDHCVPCGRGKVTADSGQFECSNCTAGLFMPGSGESVCEQCERGKFSPQPGMDSCLPCDIGHYQGDPGQQRCIQCEPGTYTDSTQESVCVLCDRGQFNNRSGERQCYSCPAGTYQPDRGQSVCLECPHGTFTDAPRSSSCRSCARGRYSNVTRALGCNNCPMGRFQPDSGQRSCLDCPAGAYTDTHTQASCKLCALGFHQPLRGNTSCLPCQAGYFSNAIGATECTPCSPGSAQPGATAQACVTCDAGTYQPAFGQARCLNCPPGWVSPSDGARECVPCPIGTKQPSSGMSECVPCEAGTFSTQLNATECVDCPSGMYQDRTGASECTPCEAGTFTAPEVQGATLCTLCDTGQYQDETGETLCKRCPSGHFQNERGQSTCKLCDAGEAAGEGQQSCQNCPPGQVAPFTGMASCVACGQNSRNSADSKQCECEPGYYQDDLDEGAVLNLTTQISCLECPKGADCDLPGTTLANMQTNPGWWRPATESLNFYRCLLPAHCSGGRESRCDEHRTGPICAVCEEGYRSTTGTSECTKCPSKERSWGVTIGISSAVLVCLLLMYFIVLRSDRGLIAKHSLREAKRIEWDAFDQSLATEVPGIAEIRRARAAHLSGGGILDGQNYDEVEDALTSSDEELEERGLDPAEMANPQDLPENHAVLDVEAFIRNHKPQLAARNRRKPSFTWKMKILIGFFQIATNLSFQVDIPWPSYYVDFIQIFTFFSLDFVPWQSVGCATLFDYYTKILIVTIVPLVLFALLVVFYLMPQYVIDMRDMSDDDTRRVARKQSRRKFWKLVLFTIFLMWPNVSSVVLGFFVCKRIEGETYLLNDMTLRCYDDRWNRYLLSTIAWVVVYPIGIPAIFFYFLHRYRKRLSDPDIRVQLGFLYEAYHYGLWWFELADMAHKLALTSLIAFMPLLWQMPAGMIVVVIYTMTILLARPYVRKGDDRLHILVNANLFLLLLAGYILLREENRDGSLDTFTNVAMSSVLIGLTLLLIIIFLFMSVKNIRKMYRRWQRVRRLRGHEKDEDIRRSDTMQLKLIRHHTGQMIIENDGTTVGVIGDGVDLTRASISAVPIRTHGGNVQRAATDVQFELNPMFAVQSATAAAANGSREPVVEQPGHDSSSDSSGSQGEHSDSGAETRFGLAESSSRVGSAILNAPVPPPPRMHGQPGAESSSSSDSSSDSSDSSAEDSA